MTEKLKDEYIREAAYYIWEKEGRPESDGYEFWMKAIKQLSTNKAKANALKAKPAPKKVVAPAKKPVAKPAPAVKKVVTPVVKKVTVPVAKVATPVISKPMGSVVKKVAVKLPAKKPAVIAVKKK